MRLAVDIHADIEADRQSRDDEINLLERIHNASDLDDERKRLRRMIVLLAYAHLEGFCKFALSAYVSEINARNITCEAAATPIAAASLSQVFAVLRDSQRKHREFAKVLPDDSFLHLSAREQQFVENFEKVYKLKVDIPDKVIDTKSNVDTDILKKLLFQLGLNHSSVEEHRGILNRLLGTRNAIAHGDRLKMPTSGDVEDFLKSSRKIMEFLQAEVFNALATGRFLKVPSDDDPRAPEEAGATGGGPTGP